MNFAESSRALGSNYVNSCDSFVVAQNVKWPKSAPPQWAKFCGLMNGLVERENQKLKLTCYTRSRGNPITAKINGLIKYIVSKSWRNPRKKSISWPRLLCFFFRPLNVLAKGHTNKTWKSTHTLKNIYFHRRVADFGLGQLHNHSWAIKLTVPDY